MPLISLDRPCSDDDLTFALSGEVDQGKIRSILSKGKSRSRRKKHDGDDPFHDGILKSVAMPGNGLFLALSPC